MKSKLWIGAFAAMVIVATGCNGGGSETPSAESGPKTDGKPAAAKIKVGICFDSGGRGDGSFNDKAFDGLEDAKRDFGIEEKTVDSKSTKDYETNLEALASSGCKVVFAVGFAQKTALETVAPKHPDVNFGLIDDESKVPNVRSLVFSEEQGSYLVGYLAAMVSKTGKIGFVGGKATPLITKFETGFAAGIFAAGKGELLPPKYTESWDDTGLGKEAAITLYNQGADIVYHAAGRCGKGVIAAAQEQKKFAIGVDSDQDGQAPGYVLTSMIKRVDKAVYSTIKDTIDGKFTGGTKRYDLKAKGVDHSVFTYTKDKIPADVLKKLEEIKKDIIDGKIVVPSTQDELTKFKAAAKK